MSEEEEIDAEEEAYQRRVWEAQRALLASMQDEPDPREAYDKDDPKHPDWMDRLRE